LHYVSHVSSLYSVLASGFSPIRLVWSLQEL
jgi:hypothetical protein